MATLFFLAQGFNGAATWKSRKAGLCDDSGQSHLQLQWGRDLEVAERRIMQERSKKTPCFNGAATWKSRKDLNIR